MAGMFDALMKGFSKKAENQQTVSLDVYKTKLKGIVYDDEMVEKLAPVFAKLSTTEGFDLVFDLLESKELQIEKLAGGEWCKEESDPKANNQEEEAQQEKKPLSADEILANKYKTQE